MTSAQFASFTSLDCVRSDFIRAYLAERGVNAVVLDIDGRHHIYVKFPLRQYNPQFRMKTVIAHYDRAAGTPGANDNSAAVSFLMDWAVRLNQMPSFHNVRLIFTDGEECTKECRTVRGELRCTVKAQGSFDLAAVFRRLGITGEDVYVFDCVGRGTLPILARNASSPSKGSAARRSLIALEERAEVLLRQCTARHLCLPLPYSDNAGFIAQGIPAVCITMLPNDEAEKYLAALMRFEGLSRFVLNRSAASPQDTAKYTPMLPETWALFHTMQDDAASLTPQSAPVVESILNALALKREVKTTL